MKLDIEALGEQADELADAKCRSPGEFHPNWHDARDKAFALLIVERCATEARKHLIKGRSPLGQSVEAAIRQLLEDK